ncbi:MAG: hypothetical protein ACYDC6_05380 [Acidobacteriaceae bacterium]
MNDFEVTVLSDLAALKSQMGSLIGLGQPGRLNILEERLERHELYLQRMKGLLGAFFVLMSATHIVIDYIKR